MGKSVWEFTQLVFAESHQLISSVSMWQIPGEQIFSDIRKSYYTE